MDKKQLTHVKLFIVTNCLYSSKAYLILVLSNIVLVTLESMFLFSRVMTNDLMAKLNMKGKRGKLGLGNSRLFGIIKGISSEYFTYLFCS